MVLNFKISQFSVFNIDINVHCKFLKNTIIFPKTYIHTVYVIQ